MPADKGGSRALLRALRAVMAGAGDGQQRLDKVVHLVANNMVAEVCSIYLKRDERTLELCATEGLRQDAVHSARLRIGQGLVGRIAERAEPLVTEDAPSTPGFRYLPETGEEIYQEKLLLATTEKEKNAAYSSVSLAGGALFFTGMDGSVMVVKPGRKYELIARNKVESALRSTPAFEGKRIYLRAPGHLYCFGK